MKDQKFKKQIAEIAAKIAEAPLPMPGGPKTPLPMPGGANVKDKLELPTNYAAKANALISTPKDMAQAVLDFMEEILKKEKSMQDLEGRAGWSSIFQRLRALAGEKVGSPSQKEVPADDSEEPAVPNLKEAFDKIKRK